MINRIKKLFLFSEAGQGMVEYGLILALVSIMSIGALTVLGGSVAEKFDEINTVMSGNIVVAPEEEVEVDQTTLDYEWVTSSDLGAYNIEGQDGTGYFHYIGSDTTVTIPHVIHTHEMTSYAHMFKATNVDTVISTNTNIANMDSMFYGSTATSITLTDFYTSRVESAQGMFMASAIEAFDLSGFSFPSISYGQPTPSGLHKMFDGIMGATGIVKDAETAAILNDNSLTGIHSSWSFTVAP